MKLTVHPIRAPPQTHPAERLPPGLSPGSPRLPAAPCGCRRPGIRTSLRPSCPRPARHHCAGEPDQPCGEVSRCFRSCSASLVVCRLRLKRHSLTFTCVPTSRSLIGSSCCRSGSKRTCWRSFKKLLVTLTTSCKTKPPSCFHILNSAASVSLDSNIYSEHYLALKFNCFLMQQHRPLLFASRQSKSTNVTVKLWQQSGSFSH